MTRILFLYLYTPSLPFRKYLEYMGYYVGRSDDDKKTKKK